MQNHKNFANTMSLSTCKGAHKCWLINAEIYKHTAALCNHPDRGVWMACCCLSWCGLDYMSLLAVFFLFAPMECTLSPHPCRSPAGPYGSGWQESLLGSHVSSTRLPEIIQCVCLSVTAADEKSKTHAAWLTVKILNTIILRFLDVWCGISCA